MFSVTNIFVVLFLAASLVLVTYLTYRAARNFSWRRLHQDRRGASYSLTMVLIVPFYLTMVVGGIEINWLFHADTLFQRTTLMAGRSISVGYQNEFEKHDQEPKAIKEALEQRGELAAALVLFSAGSGLENHELPISNEASEFVGRFMEHLETNSGITPNDDTRRRANYVAGATTVEFTMVQNRSQSRDGRPDRATVKVEYEHPFFSQTIGRYLGKRSTKSNDFYIWKFTKEIEIPLEIARSKDKTLGIKSKSQR